ncbi:MAG: site-specific DNA-methyltransferase, partial [Actinobacteria bacterium]|nr:site-specific DNA-methyltransferase [Actinomycetota bacterium]
MDDEPRDDNQKRRAAARRATTTSSFGVSRRESHDASPFYDRFTPPRLDLSVEMGEHRAVNEIFCGDASNMTEIDDNSVALVVTSPPYFAGKEYETALGSGHVPATYASYLDMLEAVFAESVRKLEPGGRIAVNVANLGRKPYRSLSSDVIWILQDRLGLLLRGELIWYKSRGAAGSCAWGSFQRPGNPVLRDLTERIVVASKGRFDRAIPATQRAKLGLPSEASSFRDEFMEATTDVWEFPPEMATRVGHPAPFPVDLPLGLINLYTYRGDLVLDPFMGSGTTAIAALRTERHYAGYDTDPEYVMAARRRVDGERARLDDLDDDDDLVPLRVTVASRGAPGAAGEDFQARAVREGRAARDIARQALDLYGFTEIHENVKFPEGVEVNFVALDQKGGEWHFDVSGGFTSSRPG